MNNLTAVESIFFAALEKDTPEERAAYLDQSCGGDAELRRHVERLLMAQPKVGSFLQAPASGLAGTMADPQITERPGSVIGPYELMEQIGEGGFGLVFVAEQQEPVRRKVALKIIKPGMDSGEVIARFEAERQALALMEHPNIARIFDGGTTQSGRPYFVMELVKGIPIIEYCDQQQLTANQRLDLFLVVCQAVQHAHGKGIIHRDLKPSNILVAPHDGVPVVKVIDFGVAKAIGQQLTNKKIYTRFTQMIGTPLYMSPEQAEVNALDVDIRSDVYSLGVLLYELLTGTTPFDKQRFATAAYDEIRRIIKEEEPPKPSTRLSTLGATLSQVSAQRKMEPRKLSALVRGDLDWIVMKALEKERSRRYETASAMAADVRRYMSEEPIEARPPSRWYRARKMARRNKAAVLTVGLVAATLLLGIVGTTLGLLRAVDAEVEAIAARDQEAEQRLAAEDQRKLAMTAATDARKSERLAKESELKAAATALLAAQAEASARRSEQLARDSELKAAANEALAKEQAKIAEEARQQALTEKQQADLERQKAVENEARAEWGLYASNIAAAQREWENHNVPLLYHYLNQCRLDFRGWEHDYLYTLANQNQETLRGHKDAVFSVAFSPDGKRLASASKDKTVKLWDTASGRELMTLKGHANRVTSVAFSLDGTRLASASDGGGKQPPSEVKIWDAASGNEVQNLLGNPESVYCVTFSPDGKRLAIAGGTRSRLAANDGVGTVRLCDAANGREVLTLRGHKNVVTRVAFSPDGRRLASASSDKTVKLWELASGQELLTLKGHTSNVDSVAFSADGKTLASASWDNTVKLWDATSGKEVVTLIGHKNNVYSVAFSPDGKRLASASHDTTVKLWDAASAKEITTLKGHKDQVNFVVFSPDGNRLASASWDYTVKLWNALGVTHSEIHGEWRSIAFSPDSKRLASASFDKTAKSWAVKLWDTANCQLVSRIEWLTDSSSLTFSPDGKRLASGSLAYKKPGELKLWDLASGQLVRTINAHPDSAQSMVFSPDGKLLASASSDKTVKLWDAANGQEVLMFKGHTDRVTSVAFSPDGKRLASGTYPLNTKPGELKVWDAASGEVLLNLKGHTRGVNCVVFSPDGKRLASTSSEKTVDLWDASNGQHVLILKGHTNRVISVAFSPDGKRLATASWDGTFKLWDAATGQELLTLKHTGPVNGVVFSPDGKRLAGASEDDTIIIWDASKSMKELEQK